MERLGSFNKHFFPVHVMQYMCGEDAAELMKTCILFWNMFRWDHPLFWAMQLELIEPKTIVTRDPDPYVRYIAAMRIRNDTILMVRNSVTCGLDRTTALRIQELLVHIVLYKHPAPNLQFSVEKEKNDPGQVSVTVNGRFHYHHEFLLHFSKDSIRRVCGHDSLEQTWDETVFVFYGDQELERRKQYARYRVEPIVIEKDEEEEGEEEEEEEEEDDGGGSRSPHLFYAPPPNQNEAVGWP